MCRSLSWLVSHAMDRDNMSIMDFTDTYVYTNFVLYIDHCEMLSTQKWLLA